ncbi:MULTISPECIES: Scr1 family TA system antitoxin-like transcriptional regulator [unclassified Streptomyces]|uniref:Scr1 family TA system antitoxin-like transcriptional regulator n=1 Tax=unclassified Streptomyces TaxID=2593676 RepID=UPI000DD5548C|nr:MULTISPECIES: Scr1 family TA system antitoxin-like transcriptional regulator [unclassified Streptomyces]QZZ28347.1 helix-turn-helix domain-containing protein [Streptomyces sp. ST1015]
MDDESYECNEDFDEAGWSVEAGDEVEPMVQAVGLLLKFCRESAGMSVVEFAAVMRYGEDMIRKLEGGRRIPRPGFLDKADTELGAQGHLRVFMESMRRARYRKGARGRLKEVEGRAVEFLIYCTHNIHGLLQTPEYIRTLFEMRKPPLSDSVIDHEVAYRLDRQEVFRKDPAPTFSIIQEQVTLERPYGGREVMKFADGTATGRSESLFNGRPVSKPQEISLLELRFGILRSQAHNARDSRAFVERQLGRLLAS